MELLDRSSAFQTRNSSVSELSLPATPTFSMRGHSRYASSISSIDAASPTLKGNPQCSPTPENLEDSYVGKRSLPDVKEESLERDEDYDMLEDRDQWDVHRLGKWVLLYALNLSADVRYRPMYDRRYATVRHVGIRI